MRARVLALVVLAGCASEPVRPAARTVAPPPVTAPRASAPAAPEVVAVARDVTLYEADHGSPLVGHVDQGEVLVWEDDGFVRVRVVKDGLATELAGYPAPIRPGSSAGVGLLVQRDTALLGPDGKEVGTAYRGAFVRLTRARDRLAEILVDGKILRVDRAALGTSPLPPPTAPRYTKTAGHLHVVLEAGSFRISSRCDETLGVVSANGRVALYRDGLEIVGTATPGSRCPPRVVGKNSATPAPEGWLRTEGMRVTAFAKARTFWSPGETTCSAESFVPGSGGGTLKATTTMTAMFLDEGGPYTRTATYRLRGVKGLLLRPISFELEEIGVVFRNAQGRIGAPPGYGEGIALCGNPRTTILGETADGVLTVSGHGHWTDAAAVHPDDVDVWYTSEAACTREVERRAAQVKGGDALAMLARSGGGC